ncbi:MAG: Cell division protein FtsL [Firmicutes bacterium]|nr:Cell division protein FtsL [candidate division NPL-UPA2 bacterium]
MILASKPLPRMPLPVQPQPRPLEAPRKQRQLENVYRLAFILMVFGALAFGAVAREAAIVGRNRTLRELTAEIAVLETTNAILRVEVARLGSTAHIERVAKEQLGMRAPIAQQVLTVGVNNSGN